MASETADNWDESLPPSSSATNNEAEEETPEDQCQYNENLEKLQKYIDRMTYRPAQPHKFKPHDELMSQPRERDLFSTYQEFGKVLQPKLRKRRLKRLTGNFRAITTEQLEQIIKNQKVKNKKKEDLHKRKQDLYYEMLTKLERQCRTQYLNVLVQKFAKFIAKLATTMCIPPQLVEPYARMQRGIFCNILLAISEQPTSQEAIYYNCPEGKQYEVCHKLAHALLSLIIKALDAASCKNPDDIKPLETDFEMDRYIKDRLMCAAEKKVQTEENQTSKIPTRSHIFKKCENFATKKAC